MLNPHLGEIQFVAFNFAPEGWALCNGQLLPINQNQALFSLLGNTYGGNGQTTFALPNLRGRVVISAGDDFVPGQTAGTESVTLTVGQLPAHVHTYPVADHRGSTGDPGTPTGALFASGEQAYALAANATFAPSAVTNVGGSQAHTNMQPYLVLNAVIALVGIFPSQN
jgi:microcystin-dependent protein